MERTNVCKSRRLRTPGKKDTSIDASWDSAVHSWLLWVILCREKLNAPRIYLKKENRWFCSPFKKWWFLCQKYILEMGGMIYNDLWCGSGVHSQVVWIFPKLRTRILRVNSVVQEIHNEIIYSNTNEFLLPLCNSSDWHFSHLLFHINFGTSMWKKMVSKEIDNKLPSSFLSGGYDPIFFLEPSVSLPFSSYKSLIT